MENSKFKGFKNRVHTLAGAILVKRPKLDPIFKN